MKILLTANKTYRNIIDTTWWYFYEPLLELGHDVFFYDTVAGHDKAYAQIVEDFKPDLIFCIMTGDSSIAPHEPWQEIKNETLSGRTRTFNWFCDDTWRFEKFSLLACRYFNVCSTPEPSYVEKYKANGFANIINANWHANSNYYRPKKYNERTIDVSFIGSINKQRKEFFNTSNVSVAYITGVSQEELYIKHCDTKIGLNLSFNANDPLLKTQMKQRVFEITAAGSLLVTQNHPGLEQYYEIDKEIITFNSKIEYDEKISFLMNKQNIAERIATKGYNRFLLEHDSKVRLNKVIKEIMLK